MKKRKKLTPVRKLFLKAERLWKECAFLRDGRECQVKKSYPLINVNHSDILQIDHCIPRADKNFFFDLRNATVVCANCNGCKKWLRYGVHHAIEQIVINREGGEVYGDMMDIHQRGTPNEHWGKIWWLEIVVRDLETSKKLLEVR